VHRVQRGDTLYSIAFRNGLDYRELARINGIGSAYTIYIGQELRLSDARVAPPAAVASKQPAAPANRSVTSTISTNKPLASSSGSTSSAPVATTSTSSAAVPPGAVAATPAKSPVSAPVAPSAPTSAAAAAGITWRWPADGQRIGSYVAGDQTKQGIDIAGRAGDPVRAAADGEIVYSGNGLIGYGELIIVKHNASLLSAYGHNRRRLVQEGDKVKAGQQIAEMGSSSASRDMLHF
jgi:lipoprotein NlpD